MIMAKESRGKAPETEAKKSSLVTAAPVAEVKEPETKKIEPKKEETIKEEPKKAVDASAKKVVGKPKYLYSLKIMAFRKPIWRSLWQRSKQNTWRMGIVSPPSKPFRYT